MFKRIKTACENHSFSSFPIPVSHQSYEESLKTGCGSRSFSSFPTYGSHQSYIKNRSKSGSEAVHFHHFAIPVSHQSFMMNRSKPDAEVATSCIALSIYTANPEYNVRASFRLVQAPIPPGAVRRGGVRLVYYILQ